VGNDGPQSVFDPFSPVPQTSTADTPPGPLAEQPDIGPPVALQEGELFFTAEGFEYVIEQSPVVGVAPLVGTQDIVAFYSYGTPTPPSTSSNTGLEQFDTSILFLYDDGSSNVSLVMIHDRRDSGSGGKVEFAFTGALAGATFLVRDDRGATEAVLPTSIWRWDSANTDGGALGFVQPGFAVTITPDFPAGGGLTPGQITAWKWLTGGPPIDLSLSDPITIRRAGTP